MKVAIYDLDYDGSVLELEDVNEIIHEIVPVFGRDPLSLYKFMLKGGEHMVFEEHEFSRVTLY